MLLDIEMETERLIFVGIGFMIHFVESNGFQRSTSHSM